LAGVVANVCISCQNEWRVLADQSQEHADLVEVEAKREHLRLQARVGGQAPQFGKVHEIYREHDKVCQRFAELAEEFLQQGPVKRIGMYARLEELALRSDGQEVVGNLRYHGGVEVFVGMELSAGWVPIPRPRKGDESIDNSSVEDEG